MSEEALVVVEESPVVEKGNAGRPIGHHAKKLIYTRFYAIMFWCQSMMFVYCCPTWAEKPTFVALEKVRYDKMRDVGLLTWDREDHAIIAMKQIPYFEMGGNPVDLEIVCNTNTHFAELVLECEAKDPVPEEIVEEDLDI
jgi:hypothetical protein